MDAALITTSTGLEGYKIVKHLGVVRGITVRSRSVTLPAVFNQYSAAGFQSMLIFAKNRARRLFNYWHSMPKPWVQMLL